MGQPAFRRKIALTVNINSRRVWRRAKFSVFYIPLLVHTLRMHRATGRLWIVHALGAVVLLLATTGLGAEPGSNRLGPFQAGIFSFSDELGGFHIVSASGTGTKTNPFVIKPDLESANPVTMVIRAVQPVRPFDFSGDEANGFTYFRILVLNNSGHAWIEFELELQEILNRPSVFGDGLSFDQRESGADTISSDSFAEYKRDFEPYDRLRFLDGKVDPLETAAFSFLITDFTPRSQFYLVLDPRIPSS
jgi:hypothetical protein